jgi:Tfp pilus assembly protein PilN
MGKVLPTAGELQKALPLKELLLQDARFMVFCVLIVVLVFAVGIYQRIPLANQLTKIIATRPKLITVLEDKSFDELKKIETNYKDKINTMNKLLAQFPYFTPELNALPNLLPKGVWLTDFRFQTEGGEKELLLTGLAYLGDRNKEFEAISALFSNLKNNSEFSKIFKKIEIVSIVYAQSYKWEVTNFAITCKD